MLTPPTDAERQFELRLAALSPDMLRLHNALQGCTDVAERVILISEVHGIAGAAAYCKHAKHDRQQFREACAVLRRVGMTDLAMLCQLIAPSKPKPLPDWYERQKLKRKRTARVPKSATRKSNQPQTPETIGQAKA
jgi:hypothetical protein